RRSVLLATASTAATALALVIVGVATPGIAVTAPNSDASKQVAPYIVQTAGLPLSTFNGKDGPPGTAGIAATKPSEPGLKPNQKTSQWRLYRDALRAQHRTVLSEAGIVENKKVAEYTTAFNGFAASLTPAEADKLKHHTRGVVDVYKNTIVHITTTTTPTFL